MTHRHVICPCRGEGETLSIEWCRPSSTDFSSWSFLFCFFFLFLSHILVTFIFYICLFSKTGHKCCYKWGLVTLALHVWHVLSSHAFFGVGNLQQGFMQIWVPSLVNEMIQGGRMNPPMWDLCQSLCTILFSLKHPICSMRCLSAASCERHKHSSVQENLFQSWDAGAHGSVPPALQISLFQLAGPWCLPCALLPHCLLWASTP